MCSMWKSRRRWHSSESEIEALADFGCKRTNCSTRRSWSVDMSQMHIYEPRVIFLVHYVCYAAIGQTRLQALSLNADFRAFTMKVETAHLLFMDVQFFP